MVYMLILLYLGWKYVTDSTYIHICLFFWPMLILCSGSCTQIFILLNHLQGMSSHFITSGPYVHDHVLWSITFLVCSHVLFSSSAVLVICPILYHTIVICILLFLMPRSLKTRWNRIGSKIQSSIIQFFLSRQNNFFSAYLGTPSSSNLLFICIFGTELVIIVHVAPRQNLYGSILTCKEGKERWDIKVATETKVNVGMTYSLITLEI